MDHLLEKPPCRAKFRYYDAVLSQVHVKEYGFSIYPTVPPDPPNNSRLTIADPGTRLVEVVISGTSSATVNGGGLPPPSDSTQVQTLTASGSSQLTVTDSDMTPASTANFDTEPEPATALTGAKISITKCTGPIPWRCVNNLPSGLCPNGAHAGNGTQIFFGGIGDLNCGHPADMSCDPPTSKICAVCTQADIDVRPQRCDQDHLNQFLVTCENGNKLALWVSPCTP
ncbi:MAG: hypothetical protein HYR55_11805 [Acidobacteria bacterium]|nr:hypothetical protein [Acidobacteriota bacterium]MBI3655851.1 hypothetical protein [Acidobacteriota bacterium]